MIDINTKTIIPLAKGVPHRPSKVYNITRKTRGKINQKKN